MSLSWGLCVTEMELGVVVAEGFGSLTATLDFRDRDGDCT